MKDKKQTEKNSDEELVDLFEKSSSIQEKLQYFSKIQDYNHQKELLNSIPENEKYKFIGKIRSAQGIATALNNLENDDNKSKTFNFIAKQFKGNNIGILEMLTKIDFDVTIPSNMLTFQLNNINSLNLDFLINIQKHTTNHSEMKFKINEYESDSTNIEYSFSEISAIIAKIEELTADIPKEMDEANKFYKIYSRISSMMIYDYDSLNKENKAKIDRDYYWSICKYKRYKEKQKEIKKIRKNSAGLYGGLIDGKAICAGYALILHEALKYVGMKSQYVVGYNEKVGHAWNQVQIDGKWYNIDATWDALYYQTYGQYKYMLLNDEDFDKTHGELSNRRTKTYHKCKNKFDYSKIQGLSPNEIENVGEDEIEYV